MEIERKFFIKELPENLNDYQFKRIEQAYLNIDPVIRVRREDDDYYMTYKGSGMMAREESNLPLTKDAYYHLIRKADGNVICKRRYMIPLLHPNVIEGAPKPPDGYSLMIELDVFDEPFDPLIMAEVEFGSKEAAATFLPPDWFGEEVTYKKEYHNSYMAMVDIIKDDPEN